jgi:hypothetical protein
MRQVNLMKFREYGSRIAKVLPVVFLLLAAPASSFALGQQHYVESVASPGSFTLVHAGAAAKLYVDGTGDFPGVTRAVGDLQADVNRVSGLTPVISKDGKGLSVDTVIIGTIGKSALIDRLIREHKIDVSEIKGKWESTLIQVVANPLPGVRRGLVIVGSDKRGTIFGIYDLSEQIGVSPWYWWADVPTAHKDELFISAGRYVQGEPAVKYRGIFFNDEAPALTGWVNAKYGGYNQKFYTRVFELLLRLKANYLWPAMWNAAFNEDDPANPKLADEYGIVMGTSHHEPMLRAQQEWKRHGTGPWDYTTNSKVLDDFWEKGIERNKNYESTITLGMRGDGDKPMSEGSDVALLEKIVADQRKILADHMTPTIASEPKVWALYKEVQDYYEKGMRVPDDITLLWCDDNWGNIRRLPTDEERKRPGGAGIYYHFDYVGGPRSYKWLNTNPIPKVWEQMNLALEYGADRIWVVNVGDGKPMEFPIEYFLDFARTPKRWGKDNLQEFTQLWAAREFGPEYAPQIASLMEKYTKYNGRRKPELLEPTTFSFANYHEAENVIAEWEAITAEAEKINAALPQNKRDAFFELILYPVKASAVVNELYITAGMNRIYGTQGRIATNDLAGRARALFKEDADLSHQYNTLNNGEWEHMMDQTHLGFSLWNDPTVNTMPAVTEMQPSPTPKMGVYAEGTAGFRQVLPQFDVFNQQLRTIEIFNHGEGSFDYTIATSAPWIKVNSDHGTITKQKRVLVTIDWQKAPVGKTTGSITITQKDEKPPVTIGVVAFRPETPARDTVDGFVEDNGVVSIEAEHYTGITKPGNEHWEKIPDYGRTLSAMSVFPVHTASILDAKNAPSLEYKMYLFNKGTYDIETILSPTLNFAPGRGLRFALAFDDQPPQIVDALAMNTQKDWEEAVKDNVKKATAKLTVAQPGYHTLKVYMVDPGLVLEKIVVSQGTVRPSYLGPPESYFRLPRRAESSPAVAPIAANAVSK